MVYFGSVPSSKANIPAADFAAEIMISLEKGNIEASFPEQRCRADAGKPRADHGNFLGRLKRFGFSRIGLVDGYAIAAEFVSYPRLQKALSIDVKS